VAVKTTQQTVEIAHFLTLLKTASRQWPIPSVSQIAAHKPTPFKVLIATLLSLRTKDEVTFAAARRLFAIAETPERIARLSNATISDCIYPVGFYRTKADRIKTISGILVKQYNGNVPTDLDSLLALPGVGRKTANLVLSEGYGIPAICVDTHVHRICNRIGWVCTKTADQTELALRQLLPQKDWIHFNPLVVAFGQNLCKPLSPICSQCPIHPHCPRIGVGRSR
jgi:endonuclease-3